MNLSSAPANDWKRAMPCEAPSDKMQVLADDCMHLHLDACMEHDDVGESTDATDAVHSTTSEADTHITVLALATLASMHSET